MSILSYQGIGKPVQYDMPNGYYAIKCRDAIAPYIPLIVKDNVFTTPEQCYELGKRYVAANIGINMYYHMFIEDLNCEEYY